MATRTRSWQFPPRKMSGSPRNTSLPMRVSHTTQRHATTTLTNWLVTSQCSNASSPLPISLSTWHRQCVCEHTCAGRTHQATPVHESLCRPLTLILAISGPRRGAVPPPRAFACGIRPPETQSQRSSTDRALCMAAHSVSCCRARCNRCRAWPVTRIVKSCLHRTGPCDGACVNSRSWSAKQTCLIASSPLT